MTSRARLGYLVSHPIQYQAPLLRRIAREPDIDLTVLFGSDFSARGYQDKGFGVEVTWDVPLMEGYRSRVLPALRDNGTVSATTPLSRSLLRALRTADGRPAFDALWVHGYASLNALRGIVAAHSLGIPVLLRAESWSGDRPRAAWKLAAKQAFFHLLRPMIAAALPIGTRNAAYWRESLGPGIPQFQVPYAVDNIFFARKAAEAQPRLSSLRKELQLGPSRPVILFASKLQTRKHADHLIEAVHNLGAQSAIRPYLLLIGDGEERRNLETLASSLQLQSSTRFLGFCNQSELPAFFALADVFVLPSRHEPWGLIVNEAMAAGCAVVVSSDVGAAPDLVTDGVNGYTYPVGNIPALTEALARVLQSPATTHSMGQASAQRIASWDFEADVHGLRRALAFATGRLRP
ncbi:MAG TPA: glycosyltransferase family 4 protein [Acidobacteriaceae bacterium]|nr:glycosyltransferase family 4 protein [Acidobacteriaceae bacterium]